jgi:hypothetical protein
MDGVVRALSNADEPQQECDEKHRQSENERVREGLAWCVFCIVRHRMLLSAGDVLHFLGSTVRCGDSLLSG